MDREARRATVHEVTRARHDLATNHHHTFLKNMILIICNKGLSPSATKLMPMFLWYQASRP